MHDRIIAFVWLKFNMSRTLSRRTIVVSFFSVALFLPLYSFAGHKSAVGSVIIDSADYGVYGEHGANCNVRHYHGDLNGVPDPAPDGCGHGKVKLISHGDGDGESIPPPPKKGFWDGVGDWLSSIFTRENVGNVVDVAAEANGILPPNQVGELVDITKEMTPQIMEKAEGIKAYRESIDPEEDTLGLYDNLDKIPENPTLSQSFFKWFNNLVN